MLQIRYLKYLDSLARERHFARAAKSCHVTQPTLSAGIKQLEESFGVLIVERDQKLHEFTAEGERILAWAQRTLGEYANLTQELQVARTQPTGQLRIGAIPTALPIVRYLSAPFAERYPGASIVVYSCTSEAIQQGLDDFSFDVGLTYLDSEALPRVRRQGLYREHYFFIGPHNAQLADKTQIGWAEAAIYPMCLLTPNMQHRRIIDARFHAVGTTPQNRIETDSLIALLSHVRSDRWYSVLPGSCLQLLTGGGPITALALSQTDADPTVGLVASKTAILSPVATALFGIAEQLDLSNVVNSIAV